MWRGAGKKIADEVTLQGSEVVSVMSGGVPGRLGKRANGQRYHRSGSLGSHIRTNLHDHSPFLLMAVVSACLATYLSSQSNKTLGTNET